MDRDEIDRMLPPLIKERSEVEKKLAWCQRRLTFLNSSIDGLTGLRDDDPDDASGRPASPDPGLDQRPVPRGVEAIRLILKDASAEMDTRQITEALTARGWRPQSSNPENATSTNAARAAEVDKNVTRRRGEGGHYLYRWVENEESPEDD